MWLLAATMLGLGVIIGVPAIAEAFVFKAPPLPYALIAVAVGAWVVLLSDALMIVLLKPANPDA